ncbi:hypothetical protein LshimejAT787_1300730 [Lyophyllum shimeji]|uniref:Uncharacterized protein n=1 Tax=Lyophyllum shimeji TaxID=47721 RepID=A0A9P3PXQ5_LYOSH|nr:hypothetical protein LshimejAT787_1300730 [Lyophyllum shimeji]
MRRMLKSRRAITAFGRAYCTKLVVTRTAAASSVEISTRFRGISATKAGQIRDERGSEGPANSRAVVNAGW